LTRKSRRRLGEQGAETICLRFLRALLLLALLAVRQKDQSEGRYTGRELQKQNGATEKQQSVEEEAANARPRQRQSATFQVPEGAEVSVKKHKQQQIKRRETGTYPSVSIHGLTSFQNLKQGATLL
jgi:hypothetical protein